MAVALNTSKRKFTKILDNITASSSQTNLASLGDKNASAMSLASSDGQPPSKRSRNSLNDSIDAEDRPDTAATAPAAASRLSLAQRAKSIRIVRKSDEKARQEPRKAPKYAPWSHDLFVERMKSFSDVKRWTPKPDKLNEVEWAKRGWVCDGLNKVACKGGCEERVVVKLEQNRKEQDETGTDEREGTEKDVDAALTERYAKLVVEGHDAECLWRKSGCKDDIYHVPMANYEDHIKPGLVARWNTLMTVRGQLPGLQNMRYPGSSPDKLAKAFPPELLESVTELGTSTNPSAASPSTTDLEETLHKLELFALYGWHGENRGKYSIVLCHECHQRVGLWLYSSGGMELDLVESHRIHCPWINSQTQCGKPVWEQLQDRLSTRVREVASSSRPSTRTQDDDERPPSSAADSIQADKKRMSRLKNAMKSFGGKLKK